ncbi:MAG: FAD-dependent oxidoreductase [Singulisphaera sp.]
MTPEVLIIGAGMGGLTAALRLARRGCHVRVVEASDAPGGLAAGLEREGFRFDAGPYLLLDRPGLAWAFHASGLDLAERVPMRRVEDVYQVEAADGSVVRIHADLKKTADGIEQTWPGGGLRYREFVASVSRVHKRLRPLLTSPRPSPATLLRTGAWRGLPFLLRPLRSVLARAGLPPAVADAVAIWTHVAGQTTSEAPSPLAFVAAVLHGVGAYYPEGGLGAVPMALEAAAVEAGVEFLYGTAVTAIRSEGGRARGVATASGSILEADAVVSNRNGVGTYLELARRRARRGATPAGRPPAPVARRLRLPGRPRRSRAPYLRFRLPGGGEPCRLLVTPAAILPGLRRDGWSPARLIAPMAYADAQRLGPAGQREYLERVLAEPWWREHVGEARVLDARTPADWGSACHLHRESMNPVMTAQFMRSGDSHTGARTSNGSTSPAAPRTRASGSASASSGVLAADRLLEDLG